MFYCEICKIFESTYFEEDLQTIVSNSSAIFTDSIISYSSSTPTHITTSNSFSIVSRSATSYKSNLLLIAQLLTALLCFLTVNHQNSTKKLTIWQTFAEASEHRTFIASVQNICNLISWEDYYFGRIGIRSSRSQVFFIIGVLINFANFTGKHLCWGLSLLKRNFNIGVFLLNLQNILGTSFFTEYLRWLLLCNLGFNIALID